jgi:hypothetical protein
MGVVAVAAGTLLAAAAWFWWRGVVIDPSPPAAVCPMVRPELLDRLLPGHGPPSEERFHDAGMRGSACVVSGPDVGLDLGVMRYGRRHGLDPVGAARQGMLRVLNRPINSLDLGDEAWYFRDGPRRVYLVVRLRTTVVQVRYEAPQTEDALVFSATLLAQEVLPRR